MEQIKKILMLIASRKGERSNTKRFALLFAQKLKSIAKSDVEVQTLTADEWDVNPCVGCSVCFQKGYCVQDASDGAGHIKKMIQEADLLVFASPVYVCHTSTDAKMLIDRCAVWLHTMPLLGTPAIALCTTSNNHPNEALDYLALFLSHTGASVLGKATAFVDKNGPLLSCEEDMDELLRDIVNLSACALEGQLPPVDTLLDLKFSHYKKQYAAMEKMRALFPSLCGEAAAWENQGYFAYESAQQAQDERVKKRCNGGDS